METKRLLLISLALSSGLVLALRAVEARAQDEASDAGPEERAVAADDEAEEGGSKIQGKKAKQVEVGGRVHAGYAMTRAAISAEDSTRDTTNEFLVKRARVKLGWRPTDWLLAVVQIDVAEAFEPGSSILRDAYVHLSPLPQLQVRVGQFKKPFSGLALQSPSKLRTIDRGPGVEFIVEDLLYGDRDLGVQLSGRLVDAVKLDYMIGAFNGSGPNVGDPGDSKDAVARMQIRPIKQLEIGANLSAKFIDDPRPRQPSWALAAGGDVRFGLKGFRLYAEGLAGADHTAYLTNSVVTPDDTPTAFAVIAMASYRHKFDTKVKFAVEPVFQAELFDPDKDIVEDHLWVFTPGINAYIGNYFRIMLDGEFVRANRSSPVDYRDAEAIKVLACFDI